MFSKPLLRESHIISIKAVSCALLNFMMPGFITPFLSARLFFRITNVFARKVLMLLRVFDCEDLKLLGSILRSVYIALTFPVAFPSVISISNDADSSFPDLNLIVSALSRYVFRSLITILPQVPEYLREKTLEDRGSCMVIMIGVVLLIL